MATKLPYRRVKIKMKDFDKDPRYKKLKGYHGVCNEGENQDEIWINKNKRKKPSDTQELTKLHELCHVRRQDAEEEYKNWRMEDDAVELEAIARCRIKFLNQAQIAIKYYLIYEYVNGEKTKLYPDKTEDLKKIHKKIKQILVHKYRK